MNVVAPPRSLAPHTILWIEDYASDMEGTIADLRSRDQEVILADTYEAAIHLLTASPGDLIVVDQQLQKDGEKVDDAGSRIIAALQSGELSHLNEDCPFVFVTGSSDWVYDCEIEVWDMPGFLGIEEKAGDLLGWFYENLPKVPVRRLALVTDAQLAPESHGDSLPEDTLSETWLGIIREVDDTMFRSDIRDIDGVRPRHEVHLPRTVVSAGERNRVRPGSQFTWEIRAEDDDNGKRSIISQVSVHPIEELPSTRIDEAITAAHADRARRARRK